MSETSPSPVLPVIRLRSPRDALATVPRLLGYRPRDSIVFLSLHEAMGVSTMRLELPAATDAEGERAAATTIAGMLCRVPEVRTLIVAVYAEQPIGEGPGSAVPRAGFVAELLARLEASGFEVHDALCVASDGWAAYRADGEVTRHPLAELEAPAPGDPDDVSIASDVEASAALPRVGDFARSAFRAAVEREFEGSAPRGEWMPGTRATVAELADAVLGLEPEHPDDDALAFLLVTLLCPDCRDVVLYSWAWGVACGERLQAEGVRINAGLEPEDEALVLDLMGLGEAGPPDRARLRAAVALMRRLAAIAPEPLRHVPLTVLAWLHWALGQGSIAGLHVDAARALDPDYGLAGLLQSALAQGMLPEWAYQRARG